MRLLRDWRPRDDTMAHPDVVVDVHDGLWLFANDNLESVCFSSDLSEEAFGH